MLKLKVQDANINDIEIHNNKKSRKLKRQKTQIVKEIYKCDFEDCSLFLENQKQLDEHCINIHDPEKIAICPTKNCELKFSNNKYLEDHAKVHKICIKKFKCDFRGCPKSFTASHNLKVL